METKKFKPFDRIIYKEKLFNGCRWHCAFFSDYNESNGCVNFADGKPYHFTNIDILPYEGNEHLVGTTDSPDEEVRLEEGELIIVFDDYQRLFDNISCVRKFIRVLNTVFETNAANWNFAIRFEDFDPSNMEETRKHILCVKNGKIIRYKS
ncbi:MAG: hypothetical protein J1E16_04275 [Muribaculaceae bacterium]|nr:hypothetical protein [Muribaculaceae bacterium]